MKPFYAFYKRAAFLIACIVLFTTASTNAQVAPELGTAKAYGAFSGAGAIESTGLTVVIGNIGTYVGAFTGFPPGIYTGELHIADAAALAAKDDLTTGYNLMNDATHAIIFDEALTATMGNGQTLYSKTYGREDLTTLSGELTFDAEGDPDAIFIIKIRAALNVSAFTTIKLLNGAKALNIYWAVDGAVSVLDSSVFLGTVIANGAIHFYGGSTLEGSALSVVGAVTLANNIVSGPNGFGPPDSLIVLTPELADTLQGGVTNYQITWRGTGIGVIKTFALSLDSGLTWQNFDTVSTIGFTTGWDIPDTSSNKAIIRLTDTNGLVGYSGVFTILPVPELIVLTPTLNQVLVGGTPNYQITWTGVGIKNRKTFALSLDSGLTWRNFDTISTAGFTNGWDVPDTSSTKAMIRITDSTNLVGLSKIFTILPTPKLIVLTPTLNQVLVGGTQNYQITWTGVGIKNQKTFALSLDSGRTWRNFDTISTAGFTNGWDVPDTSSTKAMIRITDSTNLVGLSKIFTILPAPKMTVLTPGVGANITGGTENYQITWTGVGIAEMKTFEYSLDSGATWTMIGGMSTQGFAYAWNVPDTSSTRALVRITDSNGLRAVSKMFSITRTPIPGVITVVRPARAEVIMGGLSNYRISWIGTNIAQQKTIELSLDSGMTWTLVSVITDNSLSISWDVPDTNTTRAFVRVTDGNGIVGVSGRFTIVSSGPAPGSIVIFHPLAGEEIKGGYINFPIAFTAINTTVRKTFEYSLDGGTTWVMIGEADTYGQIYSWPLVPNVETSRAIIRITDANGIVGTSGLFTITMMPNDGTIDALTLTGLDGNSNIGNSGVVGINWTYTGDIGTAVNVEYSLDYTATWVLIATVPVTDAPYASWVTPPSGSFNPVFIRVTSTKGMTRASLPFSIGIVTSVESDLSALGYSVSNYPNPTNIHTTFRVTLPVAGAASLSIYDQRGVAVGTVISQHFAQGTYDIPYNTSELTSGVYTYVLTINGDRIADRMVVTK
ncbi:MAG TPA: ice-binding family protein [Candidatus Didemnitutus sp.]|nr:ice-binding family protein [Candidatus Didemnitutus sp.]